MNRTLLFFYLSFSAFIIILSSCNSGGAGNARLKKVNAVWTQSIFFRGSNPSSGTELNEGTVIQYVDKLKKNDVTYIYVFAGPFGADGHLPAYSFSPTAVRSVMLFRKYFPELKVLPWIGGIQNKTVHLEDSIWVKNALLDTKRLIETLHVSGVHIDFEHFVPKYLYLDTGVKKGTSSELQKYPDHVNDFHRKLRKILPTIFVSSVITATSPGTNPWKIKTPFKNVVELSRYVDQLDFLYYDTGINSEKDFQLNCNYLISDFKKIKELNKGRRLQLLIGIGTFLNPSSNLQAFRNLDIENVTHSLKTIQRSITGQESILDGIAIFCDWQTDEEEWAEFRKYWLNG